MSYAVAVAEGRAKPTTSGSSGDDDAPQACDAALAKAFGFLGKRWSGIILGTLAAGPATFSELRRGVRGISDSVLSERLAELAGASLVHRDVVEGPPVGVTYRLAPAGEDLAPALRALGEWADRNLCD